MKKTKTLFASLALCGFMGLAYAASDAVTSPDAPETPGAAGTGEKVGTITDVITASTIGEPSADWKYVTHEDVKGVSDGAYTFQCGLPKVKGDELILFRAANMNSGFITTTQGGDAKQITVEFADASVVPGVIDPAEAPVLKVFGSHEPYAAVTDLFYPTTWGDELGEITEADPTYTIDGSYEYIGVRVADAYTVAVSEIKVTLEGPQYYVEAPVFVDPANEATVYGETVYLPTISALTCATEDATIYYKEGEDGEYVKYDAEKFNPNYEVTYYAYATTHEDNCKSAETTLEYVFKPIDNLVDAAAEPVGAPYKYVGELVVVAATGEVWESYPGSPEVPGMTTIVYDGKNFGMFYEKDVQVYKGNYIAAGWVAETLADGTIAAYGSTTAVEPDEPAVELLSWTTPKDAPAAGTTLVDDDLMKATTVYGTKTTADAVTIAGEDYTYRMQVRVKDWPTAANLDGTENSGSTPVIIEAKEAIDVTFAFRRQAVNGEYPAGDGKDIRIFSHADAKAVAGEMIEVNDLDGKYANCAETFTLPAGKYTVAAKGTTLGLFGFTYSAAAAAAAPAAEGATEGDAEEEVVYIVPEDGKVTTAGWVENLPVATAYDNVTDCKKANNYCTINNVVFAEATPAQDKTATAKVGEAETEITVKNVFLGTEAAGTYNVTGMWVAEGKNFVFVPVRYVHVTEEFDLTDLYGNYDFIFGYCSTNKGDMVDEDVFQNKTKQVTVRPGEKVNEVVITGIAPGLSFTVTGVVEFYTYTNDKDEVVVTESGKITVEACDVEIDGVKYRLSQSTQAWYDPMEFNFNVIDGASIGGSFGLSLYNSEDRDWTAYVNETFGLDKYVPGDLYLFGEMNAWGTNTKENNKWKFQSYDGITYTLVVPADIPADKMFIVADGAYPTTEEGTEEATEIKIRSWGGVTGMDLNKNYEVYLQNPYYVSHCNLAETFAKGSTVTFVFNVDKDGKPVYEEANIKFDGTTAIEAIDAVAGDAVYYNINGVKVENPAQGGVYIRVIDGKATKVYVK